MKNLIIFLITVLILFSCSNNSTVNNPDKKFSADITGDINFKFNGFNITYKKYETGEVEIYSEQLINPNEILAVNLNFFYQEGLKKFKLSNTSYRTYLEKRNIIGSLIKYSENINGEVEVISISNNSINANFYFSAKYKDTVNNLIKEVNLTNGYINFKN